MTDQKGINQSAVIVIKNPDGKDLTSAEDIARRVANILQKAELDVQMEGLKNFIQTTSETANNLVKRISTRCSTR